MIQFMKKVGVCARCRSFVAAALALATTVTILTSAAQVHTVTVVDGDQSYTVRTGSTDTAEILALAGVDYAPEDTASLQMLGGRSALLTLNRAFDVHIACGNEQKTVRVSGGTVAQALAKAGIVTGAHDLISADLDDAVYAGMFVDVLSIDYETALAEETIAPATDTVYSDELYVGESNFTEGQPGLKRVTYQTKLVNGVAAETALLAEEILAEPVNAVNVVGTKPKVVSTAYAGTEYSGSTGLGNASGAKQYSSLNTVSDLTPGSDFALDENNRPLNYSRMITGRATAYYGGGITATGAPARTGHVAVNPKQIPYGTKLYIITSDGSMVYGYASAEDTGGFVNHGRTVIDLYFNTYGACVNFGVRQVDIYVLD